MSQTNEHDPSKAVRGGTPWYLGVSPAPAAGGRERPAPPREGNTEICVSGFAYNPEHISRTIRDHVAEHEIPGS